MIREQEGRKEYSWTGVWRREGEEVGLGRGKSWVTTQSQRSLRVLNRGRLSRMVCFEVRLTSREGVSSSVMKGIWVLPVSLNHTSHIAKIQCR